LKDIGKTTVENIIKIAREEFRIRELSRLLVEKTLEELHKRGEIEKRGEHYVIKEDIRKSVEEECKRNEEEYKNFVDAIISCVNNYLEECLNTEEKNLVEGAFKRVIFEIFQRYTDNIVEIYGGKTSFVPMPQLEEITKRVFGEMILKDDERKFLIQEAFSEAIKKLFYNPPEVFSLGLRLLANRHLLYKIIVKNPPTEKLTEDIFKKAKLFIDTNILISYLCKGSHMHDITVNLLKETVKLGSRIFVSNWTLIEFHNALSYANHLYNLFKRGELKTNSMENEILKTFLDLPRKTDWTEYIRNIAIALENLDKDGIIEKIECKDEGIMEKTDLLKTLIRSALDRLSLDRHPDVIMHDAKMLAYVQSRRDVNTLTIGAEWFLTRDYRLKEIEKRNLKILGYEFESVMTCDIWFELILPFISADIDEKDLSIAFSKIIANAILPIPFDVVDSFIEYISASIDLPKENVEILKKILETAHIRQAVERAIVDGNIDIPKIP